jgi:hypothetical protein
VEKTKLFDKVPDLEQEIMTTVGDHPLGIRQDQLFNRVVSNLGTTELPVCLDSYRVALSGCVLKNDVDVRQVGYDGQVLNSYSPTNQ